MELDRSGADVDWEALDKAKFFTSGLFLFSGATCVLYPLSVIKTRQMVLDDPSGHRTGLRGSFYTSRTIMHTSGFFGFYRGIGTVIAGAIPARVLYLGTLEAAKSSIGKIIEGLGVSSEAAAAGMTSFLAGGVASLSSQAVVVPVDVVSQRLMVSNKDGYRPNGIQEVKNLLKQEGPRGLYRGFTISLLTYVPSSAVWWSAYAAYKQLIWEQFVASKEDNNRGPSDEVVVGISEIFTLQTVSALCAGLTSGFVTNPLDVVKTRLQTREVKSGVVPNMTSIVKELYSEGGWRNFYRGVVPRMINVALWGTAMVSVYEFLKRISVKS